MKATIKKLILLCFTVVLISLGYGTTSNATEALLPPEVIPTNPRPFILDMDFCTDVDDACALRVAANLHKMGVINLRAVGLCVTGGNNLQAANGLLEYSGVHNIPIGRSSQPIPDSSPYWGILSQYSKNMVAQNSVSLYRSIIWQEICNGNNPVTICTTGYVTNLADLMKSEADGVIPYTGIELLCMNNTRIFITGGSYPDGMDNNFFYEEEAREAIYWIVHNYGGRLYFIQNNCGGPITVGDTLQKDSKYKNDPLVKSLEAWGTTNGRAGWDPVAVWIAAQNHPEDIGMLTEPVSVWINRYTGVNAFEYLPGSQYYRVYRAYEPNYYHNAINALTIPF